jgi:hypothetical protein
LGLSEFKSQASQSSSKFFSISFNPCIIGINEQGLRCIMFLDGFMDPWLINTTTLNLVNLGGEYMMIVRAELVENASLPLYFCL